MIVVDAFVGYIVSRFLAGKKPGERGRVPSFRFRVKESHVVHLHHWFLCSLALVTLFFVDVYNTIVYGFLVGSALQGLMYKDFYKIIYKHKEESIVDPS